MAEGLDTGDMLLKDTVTIEENDNFENIHDKLGECGAALIVKTLEGLENGSITPISQDDSLSTYAAKITKEDCVIDWSKSAKTLHDLIRGLSPIPLSFTHTPDGKMLKIVAAELVTDDGSHGDAGEVISTDDGICVACGSGILKILKVLPEGKPRMNADDFVRGRKIAKGDVLK
jgi:methionyl-tRNA formyltransferase